MRLGCYQDFVHHRKASKNNLGSESMLDAYDLICVLPPIETFAERDELELTPAFTGPSSHLKVRLELLLWAQVDSSTRGKNTRKNVEFMVTTRFHFLQTS